MATYYPGQPNAGATHGDIIVNGYGERLRIIGESPRGAAWLVISERDIRRVILKTTPDTLARAIVQVNS